MAPNADAAFARASIFAKSPAAKAALGVTQEPPTQSTLAKARYCGARAASMPPVGQKRAPGNGPARDFSASTPPMFAAGKNLNAV